MNRIGFDSQKYIHLQSARIRERIDFFGGKLYLEFGGKLFDDYHASRVLPGFAPDNKIRMLMELRDQAEIVIAINANDIEKNKVRGDLGITYDSDVIRLVDVFRECGLYVGSIALTQYNGQSAAVLFERRLKAMGLKVYKQYYIPDYPSNVAGIVSEEGYGRNDYIETARSLIVVTAPGPGSGKMATCLSQLYHEHKRGVKAGYAKFETFPIWNLPLKHPVNLAYEAATADLNDVNMIDPFHLEAYGETTVNYNRDIEIFPVLQEIFRRIYGECPYKSPTDMGVNMAGKSIVDDEVCREASCQEIIRRYYKAICDRKLGLVEADVPARIEVIMQQAGIRAENRKVVEAAHARAAEVHAPATAIQLADGHFVTGRVSDLMTSPASAMLNAIKYCAGMADAVHLLSPRVLEPIISMKKNVLKDGTPRLSVEEVLIAMSVCADMNPSVELAMSKLGELAGCEAHSTVMLTPSDQAAYRKLGINLSSDPEYLAKFDL